MVIGPLDKVDFKAAGYWLRNTKTNKKVCIVNRVDGRKAELHPNDNMLKINLAGEYIVVDVDGGFSHATQKHIHLTSGQTLPLTFYTQTTAKGSIHAYYDYNFIAPKRVTNVWHKVDVFPNGVIFEQHFRTVDKPQPTQDGMYLPDYNWEQHDHPIATLPEDHPIVIAYLSTATSFTATSSNKELGVPLFRPDIAKAAKQLLAEDFPKRSKGERNKVAKMLLPRSHHPKKGTRPDITIDKQFVTYQLINDLAAKLSTVAELSTAESREVCRRWVELHGLDPDFNNSQLDKNIYATLPSRDSILKPRISEELALEEMLAKQPKAEHPLFKTSVMISKVSRLAFIRLDRLTGKPARNSAGEALFDLEMAKQYNPERAIHNEEGKVVDFDTNVPLVYTTTDPLEPAISYNEDDGVPIINLYQESEYLAHKQPIVPIDITENIFYKAFQSIVEPQYRRYMMRWYGCLFFDTHRLPTTWPFMCTPPSVMGGSGKSIITVNIPAMAGLMASIEPKTALSGWSDIFGLVKGLSLEDAPEMKLGEWDDLLAVMKKSGTSALQVQNNKHGSIRAGRLKVAWSGSSNFYPKIRDSDRRMCCLEPAHIHEETGCERLSEDEALKLDELVNGVEEHVEEFQGFVNWLYHFHVNEEFTVEDNQHMYVEAPQTKYRHKWISGAVGYSKRLYKAIAVADELIALIKEPDTTIIHQVPLLSELLGFMLERRSLKTGKVAMSYKWWAYLAYYVGSAELMAKSKTAVADSLGVEFTNNIGEHYLKKEGTLYKKLDGLTAAGPKPIELSMEEVGKYRAYIEQLIIEGK